MATITVTEEVTPPSKTVTITFTEEEAYLLREFVRYYAIAIARTSDDAAAERFDKKLCDLGIDKFRNSYPWSESFK